ncbi:GNAT family N-acetyltransferase [Bacillus sp. B1-b2]|uniref:GNAT family N-acetyltransferase n=1 Tax=Bacillus sp. B1-b2 TaxID=2653201 RepID=UPI001261CD52|nr:GNAT family protein [Bacillus sp. B1-b2]KAB7671240.1 GNAT family N-acetyltransferase [Bacillus sp. B1-b2]
MTITFKKLEEPTDELVNSLNKWENDPAIVPFIHPCRSKEEVDTKVMITKEELTARLSSYSMYLIYLDNLLVGEMNFIVDPKHLFKQEEGSAWIGITIGENAARGRGVGFTSLSYLESEIKRLGLNRIELGVFAFNQVAHKLYKKLGYKEIGINKDFTYYQDKMWDDIRMEKYIK